MTLPAQQHRVPVGGELPDPAGQLRDRPLDVAGRGERMRGTRPEGGQLPEHPDQPDRAGTVGDESHHREDVANSPISRAPRSVTKITGRASGSPPSRSASAPGPGPITDEPGRRQGEQRQHHVRGGQQWPEPIRAVGRARSRRGRPAPVPGPPGRLPDSPRRTSSSASRRRRSRPIRGSEHCRHHHQEHGQGEAEGGPAEGDRRRQRWRTRRQRPRRRRAGTTVQIFGEPVGQARVVGNAQPDRDGDQHRRAQSGQHEAGTAKGTALHHDHQAEHREQHHLPREQPGDQPCRTPATSPRPSTATVAATA